MNDTVLIEIYGQMLDELDCSVDDILEAPKYRDEFLLKCQSRFGCVPEYELLHRLVYLRKRSRLPRSRDIVRK